MLQTIIHSTKVQILSIFSLALVLRLFYLAAIRDAPYFHTLVIDAFEYDHLATQILRGNWLLDPAVDMYVHGPLYPYLLALLKGIGLGRLGILLFQAVLGALICVLIHRVASYLFPHPIPLVAGLLAAGYWPFVFYNGQLLATTLVMLVGLGLAVLLLHYAPNLTYGSAIGGGILLGLLVMGRSNTLLLLPLLLGWIYLTASGLPRRRVTLALAFALTFFLILLPFFLRNYQVQGTPIPFQGGFSFYIGTNPAADAPRTCAKEPNSNVSNSCLSNKDLTRQRPKGPFTLPKACNLFTAIPWPISSYSIANFGSSGTLLKSQ